MANILMDLGGCTNQMDPCTLGTLIREKLKAKECFWRQTEWSIKVVSKTTRPEVKANTSGRMLHIKAISRRTSSMGSVRKSQRITNFKENTMKATNIRDFSSGKMHKVTTICTKDHSTSRINSMVRVLPFWFRSVSRAKWHLHWRIHQRRQIWQRHLQIHQRTSLRRWLCGWQEARNRNHLQLQQLNRIWRWVR